MGDYLALFMRLQLFHNVHFISNYQSLSHSTYIQVYFVLIYDYSLTSLCRWIGSSFTDMQQALSLTVQHHLFTRKVFNIIYLRGCTSNVIYSVVINMGCICHIYSLSIFGASCLYKVYEVLWLLLYLILSFLFTS